MSKSLGDADVGTLFPLWVWDLVCPALAGGVAIQENGLITLVNDRFASIVGHSRERLIGRSAGALIVPGDRALLEGAAGRAEGGTVLRLIGGNGAAFPVHLAVRSTDLGSGTVDVLCLSERPDGPGEAGYRAGEVAAALGALRPVPAGGQPSGGAAATVGALLAPILPLARLMARVKRIALQPGAIDSAAPLPGQGEPMRRAILDALALAVEAAPCGSGLLLSATLGTGRLVVRIAPSVAAGRPAGPAYPRSLLCLAAGPCGCAARGAERVPAPAGGTDPASGAGPQDGTVVELTLPAAD